RTFVPTCRPNKGPGSVEGLGRMHRRARAGLLKTAARCATAAVLVAAAQATSAAATSTPPPTPVGVEGSPSPFPTVLQTPRPAPHPPAIRARLAVLEDMSTGQVLDGKRAADRRPIASLTKIMTAMIV